MTTTSQPLHADTAPSREEIVADADKLARKLRTLWNDVCAELGFPRLPNYDDLDDDVAKEFGRRVATRFADFARLESAPPARKIERLSGPRTHVCWTPDYIPESERVLVSLVRETDLQALESAPPAEPRCEQPGHVLRVLKAIAESYPVRGELDRYVVVNNPDYQEDNGSNPSLVIDVDALAAAPAPQPPAKPRYQAVADAREDASKSLGTLRETLAKRHTPGEQPRATSRKGNGR